MVFNMIKGSRTCYYLSVRQKVENDGLKTFQGADGSLPYISFGSSKFHIELRKNVRNIPFEIRLDFESGDKAENLCRARQTQESFLKKKIPLPPGETLSETWTRLICHTDETLGYVPDADKTAELIRNAWNGIPVDVLRWAGLA